MGRGCGLVASMLISWGLKAGRSFGQDSCVNQSAGVVENFGVVFARNKVIP